MFAPRGGSLLRRRFGSAAEMHGTTILCVRRGGKVCMIGDGQVSMGSIVVKPNAKKVRKIGEDILVGFAGSTADAFTLLERLEAKLEEHPGQLTRACVDLARAGAGLRRHFNVPSSSGRAPPRSSRRRPSVTCDLRGGARVRASVARLASFPTPLV